MMITLEEKATAERRPGAAGLGGGFFCCWNARSLGAAACILALLLSLPASGRQAFAQDSEAEMEGTIEVSDSTTTLLETIERLDRVEAEPVEQKTKVFDLEPVLGGIKSGASITGGARIIPYQDERFSLAVEGRASIRRYWGAAVLAGYDAGPFVLHAFTRYRHLPEEDFYGLGVVDEGASLYHFGLNETMAGTLLGVEPFERALLGIHGAYMVNDLGRGQVDDAALMDQVSRSQLLALGGDTRYAVGGLWFEMDLRDTRYKKAYGSRFAPTRSRLRTMGMAVTRGVYASAELRRYQQVDGNAYSFSEAELESQQFLPFPKNHVLGFRQYLLTTLPGRGDEVPFYLMPTLGGSRSLRAYRSERFRDRNVLLFNTEYRWTGLRYVQPVVFLDAGYIFPGFGELRIQDALIDYGAGLRFVLRNRVRARAEFAYGEHGFRPVFRVGSYL